MIGPCIVLSFVLVGALACTPPSGYVQTGASGQHYYKLSVTDELNALAKQRCQDDDPKAHLAYFKTPEEYGNIKALAVAGEEYWVGLENPDVITCTSSSECTGKLKWSDGIDFVSANWITDILKADQGVDSCLRTNLAAGIIARDKLCSSYAKARAMCQYTCATSPEPEPEESDCSGDPTFTHWAATTSSSVSCSVKCSEDCDKATHVCIGYEDKDAPKHPFGLINCSCHKSTIVHCPGKYCGPRSTECN